MSSPLDWDVGKDVTKKELNERLARREKFRLVDVREQDEIAEGMIPTAVHIPVGQVERFAQRAAKWSPEDRIIVYCRSGKRSEVARVIFQEQGFRK